MMCGEFHFPKLKSFYQKGNHIFKKKLFVSEIQFLCEPETNQGRRDRSASFLIYSENNIAAHFRNDASKTMGKLGER